MAGIASVSGSVAFPALASAESEATDEHPDLEPIRALLDAHDVALQSLKNGSFDLRTRF